jgi:hypothetical protein
MRGTRVCRVTNVKHQFPSTNPQRNANIQTANRIGEHRTPNIQNSVSRESEKSSRQVIGGQCLVLEAWSFSGAWGLDFGAFCFQSIGS